MAPPHPPQAANRRGAPSWHMFAPLVYATVIPSIRHIGKRVGASKQTTHLVFGASVLTALAHAGYMMSQESSVLG
ncbi:hypothetical protein NFJ02_08g138970 [Pycnococcus provasolii]